MIMFWRLRDKLKNDLENTLDSIFSMTTVLHSPLFTLIKEPQREFRSWTYVFDDVDIHKGTLGYDSPILLNNRLEKFYIETKNGVQKVVDKISVKRNFPSDLTIRFGSPWLVLSRSFCEYLVIGLFCFTHSQTWNWTNVFVWFELTTFCLHFSSFRGPSPQSLSVLCNYYLSSWDVLSNDRLQYTLQSEDLRTSKFWYHSSIFKVESKKSRCWHPGYLYFDVVIESSHVIFLLRKLTCCCCCCCVNDPTFRSELVEWNVWKQCTFC
jgi:hypothetical protein